MELRTERLVLRRFEDADREPFAAMNGDPRVMEHFVAPMTRDESDAFVDRIESRFADAGYSLWAVEVIDGPGFIGFTGLWDATFEAPFTPAVEVGWRLAADGLQHVPGQDFDHPACPEGHPVRPHVLYRFPDLDTRRREAMARIA